MRFGFLRPIVLVLTLWAPLLAAEDEPKQMTVNITSAADNAALPGVRIRWNSYGSTGPVRGETTTDGDGYALVPIPPADFQYFQLQFSRNNYVPIRASWPARGDGAGTATPPGTYDIVMEPTRTIGGKVVDESGQPVNGASVVVSLSKKLSAPNATIDVSWKTLKTKPDGSWLLENSPSSLDSAQVSAFHPQFANSAEGFYMITPFEPVSALLDGSAVITLPHGVPVEGTVTAPDGKPIAGAKVGWGVDRVASNVLPEITTDKDGKFIFGAKPDITATITVKARGMAPELKQVPVGKDKATVDFRMQPAKTITGKVVGPDGKPVPGTRVYIDTWRASRTINQSINADGDGRFVWKEAPEDEVLVDILAPGYAPKRRVPMKAGAEELVISVAGGVKVHGTVVDAETGKPIEKFKIVRGIMFENNPTAHFQTREARGGENGDFRMTLEEPYPAYVIRIDAPGYKRAVSRTFKSDESSVELEFKLEKGKSIQGIVKDPTGKPLSGVKVMVATPSQTAYVRGLNFNDQGNDQAVTDDNGRYELPQQITAYSLVIVTPDGYANISGDQIAKSPDITLLAWGKVEGTLTIQGKPAPGQDVQVNLQEMFSETAPRVYFDIQTKTDANGKFMFARVPAGKVAVTRYVTRSMGSHSMSMSTHTARAEVKSGETATVKLGGVGRPVMGKVNLPADKLKGRAHNFQNAMLNSPTPKVDPKFLERLRGLKPEEQMPAWKEWNESPEGKAYAAASQKASETMVMISIDVKPDGTFTADDVPAGDYELNIALSNPTGNNPWGEPIATIVKPVSIPDGKPDEPFDVGTIDLEWVDPKPGR